MLLLSLLNFLFGNLRQAVANPLRQGAVIETRSLFPEGSLFVVVSQWVILPRVFGHCEIDDNETSLVLTSEVQWKYCGRPRMMAFGEGCHDNRITGKPDLPLATFLLQLLGVFLCTEAS